MGRHVDKILLQEVLNEEKQPVKEVKVEKQKAFKELVERVNNIEKALDTLSKAIDKKEETKE